jgi:hypothetical protein
MSNTPGLLKVLLWLIALHSFIVGLILISTGNAGMQYFGFTEGNVFFQVQGGVFHLVMCIAYILALINIKKNSGLILFIILAKCMAFIYLLIYYFLINKVGIIFLAGVADGIMALAVYYLNKKLNSPEEMIKEKKDV